MKLVSRLTGVMVLDAVSISDSVSLVLALAVSAGLVTVPDSVTAVAATPGLEKVPDA